MKSPRSKRKNPSDRFPRTLVILFVIMALLSGLGLDYMNWSRGKTSYVFSLFSPKKIRTEKPAHLGDIVINQLKLLSISPRSQDQFWDSDGIHHLMIDLWFDDYLRLEEPLEKCFKDEKATILKKDEHEDEEKKYFLWQIIDKNNQKLSVLFSSDHEDLVSGEDKPDTVRKNMVALIVDDLGYSLKAINSVCELDIPLTVAIIPHSPLARQTAEIARRNGLEIILHLPLESVNEGSENRMEGIILSEMSPGEIISTLEDDLSQVPDIRGVNNHMGSKITKNKKIMRLILQRLKKENLYFIDSLTTGDSVALSLARRMGLPSAEREVFLDGELDEAYITGQLESLFKAARINGSSVGICHPNALTIKTLKKVLPRMDQYRCELVPASKIVR